MNGQVSIVHLSIEQGGICFDLLSFQTERMIRGSLEQQFGLYESYRHSMIRIGIGFFRPNFSFHLMGRDWINTFEWRRSR